MHVSFPLSPAAYKTVYHKETEDLKWDPLIIRYRGDEPVAKRARDWKHVTSVPDVLSDTMIKTEPLTP